MATDQKQLTEMVDKVRRYAFKTALLASARKDKTLNRISKTVTQHSTDSDKLLFTDDPAGKVMRHLRLARLAFLRAKKRYEETA